MAVLHVYLFGGLVLTWGEEPLPTIASGDARSLLAYLFSHRKHPHTRDLLSGTFWPELPDSTARRRLSQALWQVRNSLGEFITIDLFFTEGDVVQINPELPLWIDVEAFESHIASARWQRAADLYQGDFMGGYYDDWLLVERERLRELYLTALQRLVERYKHRGHYEQALVHARRLVSEDPWHEEAHREVMRLYHLLGRNVEALQQFETCCERLKEDFDASPGSETVALAQEIARSTSLLETAPHLPQTAPVPIRVIGGDAGPIQIPLVGRQEERAVLLSNLEAAIQGLGGLTLVEGETGVGKTRLLEELARDAEWRGVQVLWGHSREMPWGIAFEPWVEALQSVLSPLRIEQWSQLVDPIWLQVLRSLLPELATVAPEPAPPLEPQRERARLIDAFTQFFVAWGEIAPLMLILEDLHWADEDSLALLVALDQRLSAHKVMIVGSYRGDEARARTALWEQFQALHRARRHEWLRLCSLDAECSIELIRRSLGMKLAAPRFATRLYEETGGNPLFILEILRSLYAEGLLFQDTQGHWSTPWDETTVAYAELPLPSAVEEVIAHRLVQLAPVERSILETAAVLGEAFDFRLLQQASGLQTKVLLPAVNDLVRHHILAERPATYEFSHDQIRQVIYHSLTPEARRAGHRRIAQALEVLYPQREAVLAHHFAECEVWDEAVEHSLQAAQQAQAAYAYQAAWEHYTRALDVLESWSPFPERRNAELAFQARMARCDLAWVQGRIAEGKSDLEAALQLAEELSDPERQAMALNQQSYFLCNAFDEYEASREAAQAALVFAQEHHLPRQEAIAQRNLGKVLKNSDRCSEAESALHHAVKLWEEIGERGEQMADTLVELGQVQEYIGAVREAKTSGYEAIKLAQAAQAIPALGRAYALMARLVYRESAYAAAIDYHQKSLEQIRRAGHSQNEAVELSNLGFVYWTLRDYERAIAFQKQGMEIYRQIDNRRGLVFSLENLAALYHEVGRYAEARDCVAQGLALAQRIDVRYTQVLLLVTLGRLHLDQRRVETAERTLNLAWKIASDLQSPYTDAWVSMALGMMHCVKGEYAQAEQDFTLALENFVAAGETDLAIGACSYLAVSKCDLGKLSEAVALSKQAVSDLEASPGGEYIQDIYFHHWRIMHAGDDHQASTAALEKAYQSVQAQLETLPDAEWRHSFRQVPINRQILTAWEMTQPNTVSVRLSRINTPTGRPLNDDEYVEVFWTVAAPEDDEIGSKVARRRHRIRRLLREADDQGAEATVADLAQALDVSARTIKRDLAALRAAGHQVATRGDRTSWSIFFDVRA